MVSDPDISAEGIEAVLDLALACGALTPDRPAPWRIVMFLADQLEVMRPELAISARRTALANLARLEPKNDSVTLARLTDAVEANPTAEERVRAYERLLDDQHASKLGAAVRSRLAYQLAMLQNRMGNTELFARWLGDAVRFDPANPQAAQAAAGFFRTRIDEPAIDAELLAMAVEANPRDLSTWSALVTVLLDGAAFTSAERVVRTAIKVANDDKDWRAANNLTSDLATALWGQGRRDEAQRELGLRLRMITEDYRQMLQYSDATLTPDRIKAVFPRLPASLSLTALALAQGGSDTELFERLIYQALHLAEDDLDALRKDGFKPHIDMLLDKAMISLLFRKDPAEVGVMLEDAFKQEAISPQVHDKFKALLAWRNRKYDEALKGLEPFRAQDSLAQFAYASTLVDAGRTQEGAREFHALAKSNVGTTLGLMALEKLAGLLKQPSLLSTQLSPEIAQRAQALDKAIADNLSTVIDHIVAHPTRALTVRAELVTRTPGETPSPFSWIGFKITMVNQSGIPLAVGRRDPISSQLVMRGQAPAAGRKVQPQPAPADPAKPNEPAVPVDAEKPIREAVVPFDQDLQIEVNGQIEFVVEASNTPLGVRLAQEPLLTHLASATFVTNARDFGYGAMPGFLGTVASVIPFPVMGVELTQEWVKESLAMIAGPRSNESVVRLVLLAHAAAKPSDAPSKEVEAALSSPEIFKAIADGWLALDPISQAWVVTALPQDTPAMQPVIDAIRSSTAPEVLTSWMLARVTEAKDPMLDVARRTGDPRLIRLADAVTWVVERAYRRAIEAQGVGGRRNGGARP
jgi:tetratricopeptide (TPR) repeat protein